MTIIKRREGDYRYYNDMFIVHVASTCRCEQFSVRGEGEGVNGCLVASEYPSTVSTDDIP